jgi:hypothetical protein
MDEPFSFALSDMSCLDSLITLWLPRDRAAVCGPDEVFREWVMREGRDLVLGNDIAGMSGEKGGWANRGRTSKL